jgi:hypothetical protein
MGFTNMAYLEKKKPVKVSAVYCVSETVGRETQTKGVLADDKRCVQESTTWPWVTLLTFVRGAIQI